MKSNVTITKVASASTPSVETVATAPIVAEAPAVESPKVADANPAEVQPQPQKEADHSDMCPSCKGTGKAKAETEKEEKKMEDAEPSEEKEASAEVPIKVEFSVSSPKAESPYEKGKRLKYGKTGGHFSKPIELTEKQKAFAEKMNAAFSVDDVEKNVAEWAKKNNLSK
jgi:hypothetical protein